MLRPGLTRKTRRSARAAGVPNGHFPQEQHEAAWTHGLLNAASYRDHGVYRRETEQILREMAGPAAEWLSAVTHRCGQATSRHGDVDAR